MITEEQNLVPIIYDSRGRPAIFTAIENNWYEASRYSPHRSFNYFPPQEADRDLDRYTRYELVRHSRYLIKNSPFIRGLISRLVTLTVGTGIHPVPNSSNPAWNKRAKRFWKRISKEPCVDTFDTMSQYQRIKGFERFMDGESFSILTWDNDAMRPAIQGQDAMRCTSERQENDLNQNDSVFPVDGMVQNKQGKPIAFMFRGSKKPIPAQFVVHHGTPFRTSMRRKEPILASAINWARDVDDILALEKQAVKSLSGIKDVIKTPSSEIDPETLRKQQLSAAQTPTFLSLPTDPQTREDYYKVRLGSDHLVLRSGDEYQSVTPNRPSPAWQGFIDFLSQTICLSTGLPPSILLPVDAGGTDVRRDIDIAQRVIEAWQLDISSEWQRIWEYFVGDSVDDGELSTDAPDDWDEVLWYFPRSITVDRGLAQQDREDVKAGLMSRNEYHGRYSENGEEYEEDVEQETRRRRFRIAGIPEEEPFKDAQDYITWLALDYKTVANAGKSEPEGDEGGPSPAKPPSKSKLPTNRLLAA